MKVNRFFIFAILICPSLLFPLTLRSETLTEEWATRYNGPARDYAEATSLVVDSNGNIYVTGKSLNYATGADYTTIKYASNGTQLWESRYNGQSNQDDIVRAVDIDNSGNIYVTGESYSGDTNLDYVTVKYASDGTELWVCRYNGPSNGDDAAQALKVDDAGNVYVTGYSYGAGLSRDYTTIKYTSDGTELWVSRYNGSSNGDDVAQALKLDDSGNVYVTGKSYDSNSEMDYATVKYASNGKEIWVSRYNGSNNDRAQALAVDDAGNVFVTGYSYEVGSSGDYTTIKYDSDGTELWVSRYNGPANGDDIAYAIEADFTGGVIVTGYSYGADMTRDYATIKYASDGTELWISRYNGPANGDDAAQSLKLDDIGNVYVTGKSYDGESNMDYATVKYTVDGTQLWVSRYNGSISGDDRALALAVDNAGNVYVTGKSYGGDSNMDYATVKYASNGTELWVSRYNGSISNDDRAQALELDDVGNVYITGYSLGSGTSSDYTIIKYANDGTELWVSRYNGPSNGDDAAQALKVDDVGNVYVTGYSYAAGTFRDYATIKYANDGTQLWVSRYNGPSNGDDAAQALKVDGAGNVYVTGKSFGGDSNMDYATVKYASDGTQLWVSRYNGSMNGDDRAQALTIDNSGNVYVTGYSYEAGSSSDFITIKYASDGTELWVSRYNGPSNGDDIAYALEVDNTGSVFVTGYSHGADMSKDYTTIKYASDGSQQWVSRYNGPFNGDDTSWALKVDDPGNVYVTGKSYGGDSNMDYATVKYASDGTQLWVSRYNGPISGDDRAQALAVDNAGNVYVTGHSYGAGSSSDYATIKYSSDGTELWVFRYNGPSSGDDLAMALAVDNTGNVFVTGNSFGDETEFDYVTIKYSYQNQTPTVNAGADSAIDEGGLFTGTGSFADPGDDTWSATVDYGDGTGVQALTLSGLTFELAHTYADSGVYTVTVTVTDDFGASGADSLEVTVNNVAPVVDAGPGGDIDKGDLFTGTGLFTDPGDDTWSATVDYGDGTGIQTLVLNEDRSFSIEHVYINEGYYAIDICVQDDDGGKGCDTANIYTWITTTITVDNAYVEYSDTVKLQASLNLEDVDTDSQPLSDALISFEYAGTSCGSAVTNVLGQASLVCGPIDKPQGDYSIVVSFEEDAKRFIRSSTGTASLHVELEEASILFNHDNPAVVQVNEPNGDCELFSLTILLQEKNPDWAVTEAYPGDISLIETSVSLVPIGPGASLSGLCVTNLGEVAGYSYNDRVNATCTFENVPVNTYTVEAKIEGSYYLGAVQDVLIIYDPSLGYTTGGGWFYWPGTEDIENAYPGNKTNFGFTMKYNKKGVNVKGNFLLISHLPDGTLYRVKSNGLDGLAVGDGESAKGEAFSWASFSGKCTYLDPGWLEPEGNYKFVIYVEDRNDLGTGIDKVWLEVGDKNGYVIEDMSMQIPVQDNTTEIQGGNIVIPHVRK